MHLSIVARRGSWARLGKLGLAVLGLVIMAGLPSEGRAQTSVTLTPSVASPQMLGAPVTWTATVESPPAGHTYGYQFTVTFNGQAQIVRDFSPTNTFPWVPHTVEGEYQVSVIVRDTTTAPYVVFAPVSADFTLLPWVTAPLAAGVVNPTSHPLVALFSGPPCTAGDQLLVRFHPVSPTGSQNPNPMTTNLVSCSPESANFLVAGMYPLTAYLMHWEEYNGTSLVNTGADLPFTTGALPSSFMAPTFTVNVPPTAHDTAYPLVLWQFLTSGGTATDLAGNVVWYSPSPPFMARMEPGGNFYSYGGGVLYGSSLAQYDLLGNAVVETNLEILNEQLAAKGYPTINGLNTHEARHLPDGNLLLLGARDVVSTSAQGGTPANPVDIIGDLVLVLDHNLQLVWAWDSFAHEDINRAATLNDQATPFNPDFTTANDWLHTNFAQGTADGNIILSQRSQDWVIKINYANAAGDGSVIWHMGAGDDFTLLNPPTGASCGTPNVFPWFTHQHDTAFQFEENSSDGGGTIMTVYDDGNTRFADCPAPQHSRGMVLFVDEAARQIYMETAGDLGVFSEALGSGQLLALEDGNLYASYDNGIGNAQLTEINLAGQIVYQLQANSANSYRAYRMPNLYASTFSFTATGVYVQTATPLQFATIPTGATEVQPLTITNFGLPGTVTVATSVNGSSYTVLTTAQNTCLAGITAGQSCTLPVQFNPTADGAQNDTLTITPSAGPTPATVALNGTAVAPPTFALTSTGATISSPGQSGTSAITIAPSNGYTGTVNLSCVLTAAPSAANSMFNPTCSLSASAVNITSTAAAKATATFATTAATSSALAYPQTNDWKTLLGGAALACVFFLGIPARRRSRSWMLGLLVLIVAMSGVGCGGGGGGNSGSPGTAPGTYTFTVTGTDSTTSTITGSTVVSVTVN